MVVLNDSKFFHKLNVVRPAVDTACVDVNGHELNQWR